MALLLSSWWSFWRPRLGNLLVSLWVGKGLVCPCPKWGRAMGLWCCAIFLEEPDVGAQTVGTWSISYHTREGLASAWANTLNLMPWLPCKCHGVALRKHTRPVRDQGIWAGGGKTSYEELTIKDGVEGGLSFTHLWSMWVFHWRFPKVGLDRVCWMSVRCWLGFFMLASLDSIYALLLSSLGTWWISKLLN